MKFSRVLAAACLAFSAATFVHAADSVAAVLSKARAHIGSEEALGKLQSVHYVGMVEVAGPMTADQTRIDVIFQAPYRMRQEIASANGTDTTGLDDYAGWAFLNPPDAAKRRLVMLSSDPVRHLRANIWENLAFYRGLEAMGGRIEDGGTVSLDGAPARKLTFWHDDQIRFARWFDPATGRLLLTETDDGTSIREEGELVVAGLRFPKKIITTAKTKAGTTVSTTIVFDKITVNEPLDAKLFAPPRLTATTTPPPPPTPAMPAITPLILPKLGPDSTPARK